MNNNNDMQEFLDKLAALKEYASFNGGFLTKEDIDEAFPGLDDNQQKLMEDYLKNNHIGVGEPLDDDSYLSKEDNGYLKLYLEELEELDEISEDMRRVLIMGALNNNADDKNKLINAYLKNIVDIAKLYTNQGASLQDLIGEGNVALAIAVNMINCVETIEEADSLIVKQIMNAMEEYVGIENENSKTEDKSLALVVKVTDKARELNEDLLRKVSIDELSEYSGISKNKILEAIRITDKCLDYIDYKEN